MQKGKLSPISENADASDRSVLDALAIEGDDAVGFDEWLVSLLSGSLRVST